MIKGVIKKIEVTKDKDHTQEINLLNRVYPLWYQLKNKWLLILSSVCNSVQQNIKMLN
jgi:hypothetical protein